MKIPADVQRLRAPERERSTGIMPSTRPTPPGVSLVERNAEMDAALPHVVLRYQTGDAGVHLHSVVGPFLSAELARVWGGLNPTERAAGFRVAAVERVAPLLPAPAPWSR